jgi:signal transduction histidine kinase
MRLPARLFPRSLIGQIALVLALVLLVVQAINFLAIQAERQRVAQAVLEGPVITRYLAGTNRLLARDGERPVASRRARIELQAQSNVSPEANDEDLAGRLAEIAAANGIEIKAARAALSDDLPPPPPARPGRLPAIRSPEAEELRAERFRSLLLSMQLADGRWANGQLVIQRPSQGPFWRLTLGTLFYYLVTLAAVILVLIRLLRPLRELTRAAERFRGQGTPPKVEPRGPADIRRAIEAFNAMGSRVGTLLDEKDRMLGAIGHDLRTPLASLRIRAENMDPPDERERMIATLEEMTGLLDDTLALARSGRSQEPARPLDVAALADAVVEELRELGQPVALEESQRAVACIRPHLVRGAIRNLIDNAVKYAGSAEVAVASEGERVRIDVMDRGPGIPDAQLAKVMEPFVRLEESRSRATGGTGLGISLARAAAQLHGGDLELSNREGGGLRARLWFPREEKAS